MLLEKRLVKYFYMHCISEVVLRIIIIKKKKTVTLMFLGNKSIEISENK